MLEFQREKKITMSLVFRQKTKGNTGNNNNNNKHNNNIANIEHQ